MGRLADFGTVEAGKVAGLVVLRELCMRVGRGSMEWDDPVGCVGTRRLSMLRGGDLSGAIANHLSELAAIAPHAGSFASSPR